MLRTSSRILTLGVLFGAPALAFATDFVVAPTESIQAAIDDALDGDRVLLLPGTYVEGIDFLGKAIEVVGVQGAALTILDGGGAGPVVRMANGEDASSKLRGLTITGGSAAAGAGGLNCSGAQHPTVEDCVIVGNSGKFGGGVSGSPVLLRTEIRNNTASLTHGGGVYGAPPLMQDCLVAGNRASSADGGGLYLVGGGACVIERCTIVDNAAIFANSHGGGIYVDSSVTATITRSVIDANFSTGGVFNGRGGGLLAEAPGSSVVNCTVVGNAVSGSSTSGAGVYGPFTVVNTIVRGNTGGPQVTGATVGYSVVEGGYAGVGNLDVDPLFYDEPGGDYHLTSSSPCIDAGDPTTTDEDGSVADIGAFAFDPSYDPDAVVVYCTAKASSAGCLAALSTPAPLNAPISGQLDYPLEAQGVQGLKSGIFFYGLSGPTSLPFSGGTLCVQPPVGRTPIQFSGGTGALACDGSFLLIVNDGASPFDPGTGNTVWMQSWYRDPANGVGALGTALSDAVELTFL